MIRSYWSFLSFFPPRPTDSGMSQWSCLSYSEKLRLARLHNDDLTHLAISDIKVARECLMIMVIKMRLSILELGVPMPWPATLTVIPLLFLLLLLHLLHIFLQISPYYSPFISFPHISALPLGLDVHILLSAFIYLEI